jgi:hypothetical protein
MASRDKLLARMRTNPRDWRIEDLEALALHFLVYRRANQEAVT